MIMNIHMNNKIKTHSFNTVFEKDLKSEKFQKAYNEEIARLKLARQIKRMRIRIKMTQKEVANIAKMPQSVVARIESGTHAYSLGTLYRIATVFKKEIILA